MFSNEENIENFCKKKKLKIEKMTLDVSIDRCVDRSIDDFWRRKYN